MDTVTGKGAPIGVGTQFTEDWVVDKTGAPVARSEWNPASELYTIVARDGRSWKEIFRQEKRGTRVMYGLTSDETAIIVSDTNDAGRQILSTLPLDGSPGKALVEDAEHDVTGVVYDRITRAPVRARLGGLEQSDAGWTRTRRGSIAGSRVHSVISAWRCTAGRKTAAACWHPWKVFQALRCITSSTSRPGKPTSLARLIPR